MGKGRLVPKAGSLLGLTAMFALHHQPYETGSHETIRTPISYNLSFCNSSITAQL